MKLIDVRCLYCHEQLATMIEAETYAQCRIEVRIARTQHACPYWDRPRPRFVYEGWFATPIDPEPSDDPSREIADD